ncbi:MAG: YkgJ family cysteine cluster protein [Aquabacterium sp.]|uniref:YkgJ family cysteine cluster protein n=1 Tax=Aquabacterium sp. TaxID=1872578 RepID=UPI00122178CD|nr:YkgJ family cysteine cluster protein [Aquabacterium sp.]TAK94794.1 MAG: YkgJ family cysteine cluster protein [Aquabacterium sp.]
MDSALSSIDFFRQMHAHYEQLIVRFKGRTMLLDAVLQLAWRCFDTNVTTQCQGLPELDCHKGCATCCTLRVTATAPEVFMLARFIQAVAPGLAQHGINLRDQVAKANGATCGHGEHERVALRQRCPFIAQGTCVIYQVRPLACRGLASYDRKACAQAASGKIDQIPYSEPHMRVRSLVQNALQSAMRDGGLPWANYELNQALLMALDDDTLEARWLAGEDVLHLAQVNEVDEAEMAATFDELKRVLS